MYRKRASEGQQILKDAHQRDLSSTTLAEAAVGSFSTGVRGGESDAAAAVYPPVGTAQRLSALQSTHPLTQQSDL